MPSHLSDIGFPVQSAGDLDELLLRAARAGERMRTVGGGYIRWAPGAGAEIWVQVDHDGDITGFTPHFSGAGAVPVTVTSLEMGDESPLDGRLFVEGCTEPGPTFWVDLPDAALVREAAAAVGSRLDLQVAAFAHGLRAYADVAAFEAAQAGEELRVSPEYFIPAGAFADSPTADALFAGEVLVAELRTNPVTGAPFHALLVRTLIGTVDLVCDPAGLKGEIAVGGLIDGHFWLSARLVRRN